MIFMTLKYWVWSTFTLWARLADWHVAAYNVYRNPQADEWQCPAHADRCAFPSCSAAHLSPLHRHLVYSTYLL